MLLRWSVGRFVNRVYRSRGGIWIPLCSAYVPLRDNVLIIFEREGHKWCTAAHNIVTNDGDIFYAQKQAGETPTNNFSRLYLSTVNWNASHPAKNSTSDNIASVISGTEKAPSTGYPRTNDPDTDNSGAGARVVTWSFSYGKTDFSDPDIDAGAISKAGVTSWGTASGTDPLLTAFDIDPAFAKTTNDSLKFIVNHTVDGV